MTALFAPIDGPRVFGIAPGIDFPRAVLDGVYARLEGQGALAPADVTIYVNTQRARRRFDDLLAAGPVRIAPRIRVLGQLGDDLAGLPAQSPPQRRRLELSRLTRALIRSRPDLAAGSAGFALADSLADLLAEMQMEGVGFAALEGLNPRDQAQHWTDALEFLRIIRPALETGGEEALDAEARFRRAVEMQSAIWAETPPENPILIAGSTGSRGATAELMAAIAHLPQGAVILPGHDRDMPADIRAELADARQATDHAQFGLSAFLARVGCAPDAVGPWTELAPPSPPRNALLSLALHPAPVTDQWRAKGPALADRVPGALSGLSLVEAPDPRREARAIAVAMRRALERGQTAALVTPDRTLARRVTAVMDRWGIAPDDSAGRPLALTPPGVFLRLLGSIIARPPTAGTFLALVRHPLCASGPGQRAAHLDHAARFEIDYLRRGAPQLDAAALRAWGRDADAAGAAAWADWLADIIAAAPLPGEPQLGDLIAHHLALAERLSAGVEGQPGTLWEKETGEAARRLFDQLLAAADAAGPVALQDYLALLANVLNAQDVPDAPYTPHPDLFIWGTLEARTQTADLVILGGLNEGTWPRLPTPDPWLSREMRLAARLPLPERQIGLSAHDFQQAMGAAEVILTRARNVEEGAPSVPCRWLLRLENLVTGLGDESSKAFKAVRARGAELLRLGQALDRPAEDSAGPAPRPAPRPPVDRRPQALAVTRIERLICDPYAIYARYILGLRRLDPPGRTPDHLERGTFVHGLLERFVAETRDGLPSDAATLFDRLAAEEIARSVPSPAIRTLWRARMTALRDLFLTGEVARRETGEPVLLEGFGEIDIDGLARPFRLSAKADRIDQDAGGGLHIYDYKNSLPKKDDIRHFAQQLPLTALIAEAGGFPGIGAARVAGLRMVSTNPSNEKDFVVDWDPAALADTEARLRGLLAHYFRAEAAYPARIRSKLIAYAGDYDHLSRLGEWQDGDGFAPQDVP